MKPTNVYKTLRLTLLTGLLLLTACGGPRPTVRPTPAEAETAPPVTTVDAALQAELAGEYVLAAREYERLAQLATPPQKQDFELKAVGALIKAAQVGEARQKIPLINVANLDPAFLARKHILEAQIVALEGQPEQSLQLLARAEKTRNLNPVQLAEIYRVRAQAELTLERPWNAVRSLIAREKYIVTADDIARNQQQLWHVLESQSRTQLKTQRDTSQDPVLNGWLDLAITVLENSYGTNRLGIAVEEWKKSHLQHPASAAFLQTLARPVPSVIGRIDRIALLLPLTSEYAQAAGAVRDGFMAMDSNNANPEKPKIKVYDVGADATQIGKFYAQAVQDGAQLVVGPLGLEAIDQLVKQDHMQTPTILLGPTTQDLGDAAKYVFQFGLAPEQEAAQSAERAYLDGRRHAAVLYPDTPWGQRMSTAFSNAWQRLGGIVLTAQAYPPEQGDYSDTIKNLLNITQSEQRKETLEGVLKAKLKFEPRPREDVDFIFLAADAKRARLIKPQLNYNRALRLPVYATSHVFTGQGNPVLDVDLDGIMFGDMPWMLVGDGKVQDLRQQLQHDWPYAHSPLDRLYALGVDAYAIIPQLSRISSENSVHFSGVTSGLSLERGGRFHRQLLWAEFRKGVPQLLDTFFKYKGQFEVDDDNQTAQPPKTGT
jgi:outer membrane PBP1 activator LpoA protein